MIRRTLAAAAASVSCAVGYHLLVLGIRLFMVSRGARERSATVGELPTFPRR